MVAGSERRRRHSCTPEMLGIHWTKEMHAARQARVRSPNMTYHGGKIMPTAVMKAIFWGPSWSNSTFVGDKITGLDSWYTGHSGSNYAKTVNDIPDGQMFWIIRFGTPAGAEPPHKDFSDEQIWQLVLHLRRLAK